MKKMKGKMVKDYPTVTDYQYKEKNIYKTGSRYRIRVAGMSCYADTLKEARTVRKYMKVSQQQGFII